MSKIYLSVVILTMATFLQSAVKIHSPNGEVVFSLSVQKSQAPLPEENTLTYSVRYKGEMVVQPSPVRLLLKDGMPLGSNMEITNRTERMIEQTQELFYGKTRWLKDYCREAMVRVEETGASKRYFDVIIRVYDDAAAFRLEIPFQKELNDFKISAEETYFRLAPAMAYALPLKHFQTPYENNYSIAPLREFKSNQLIGLPLLLHFESGPWLALTEVNLIDYAGMYVSPVEGVENTLISHLSPLPNDSTVAAHIRTPHRLPWRVLMLGEHPGQMIESNLVLNLSDPLQIEDPSWIRPGKVAWDWWSDRVVEGREFQGGMNTATMKYYIDFAADAGLEYMLIDATWYGKHDDASEDITTTIPEIDMPEILRHAEEKGVGIWLWVFWECVRDQMDAAFPLYEKWGIKGIKVDYMNRDDQEMVNFYRQVVELAARYHLMVDFHGAYKPTGLRRAFPNLLTREGVLGLEYSKWSDRCNPEHELLLPYTRMLAGPMDFTPGSFHVANRKQFKAQFTAPMAMGTRAHQLAMFVVYESPLQMVVDHPASFFGQTGFDFIKKVPAVWDDTRFISGEIGDYIVLARQHGAEWYVGCMTDWTARKITVPLDFLSEGKYMAHIYTDGPEADKYPQRVQAEMRAVSQKDVLGIEMASGGGAAIRLIPTWEP